MTFLLPYEVNSKSRNKYLYYFYKSLINENIDIVASIKPWINPSEEYKAVLIHWPEHLPRLEIHSDYEFLNFTLERLKHFKKFSKILYFAHNERPHKSLKKVNLKIYDEIINSSDAIFHFSDFSKDLYKFNYKFDKKQFVIPHGNYIKLNNEKFEKTKLLADLRFDPNKKIVTSIGAIRKKEEIDLLYNFAKNYLKADCYFIYAGDIVEDFSDLKNSSNSFAYIKYLIFEKLRFKKFVIMYRVFKLTQLSRNIRIFSSPISDNLLARICKATDILIICRANSLNSGNISLGFTFGCYVLGPDGGNIGQILKKFNNMVFPLKNIKYDQIVRQSLNNLNNKVAQENKKIAFYNWNWNKLAKILKNIFIDLEILN